MTEPNDLDPELDRELEALGELRRRELAARPPQWDRLAANELSPDEVRKARLAEGDSSESIERGIELFRPYDELEQRRLVTQLRKRPSSMLRLLGTVGIVLAAAASVLLWVQWPVWFPGPVEDRLALAALPAYTVDPGRGITPVRSNPDAGELVYAGTTPLEWWIRPDSDLDDPCQLIVDVLACKGEDCRRIELDIRCVEKPSTDASTGPAIAEILPTGTVRIHGKAGQLGLESGDWTIRIGLRRPRSRLVEAMAIEPSLRHDPEGMHGIELKIVE